MQYHRQRILKYNKWFNIIGISGLISQSLLITNFPSGQGGLQHGQIRFATLWRKRSANVLFNTCRVGEAHYKHVLGYPAFSLTNDRT